MFENNAFYIEMIEKRTKSDQPTISPAVTQSTFKEYVRYTAVAIGCLILLAAASHVAAEITIESSK